MSYPDPGTPNPTPTDTTPVVIHAAPVNHSTLPFTGGDATSLALIGAVAVAAGWAMVRRSRRTRIA